MDTEVEDAEVVEVVGEVVAAGEGLAEVEGEQEEEQEGEGDEHF